MMHWAPSPAALVADCRGAFSLQAQVVLTATCQIYLRSVESQKQSRLTGQVSRLEEKAVTLSAIPS